MYICTLSDKYGYISRCIGSLRKCRNYRDAALEVGWKAEIEGPFRKGK